MFALFTDGWFTRSYYFDCVICGLILVGRLSFRCFIDCYICRFFVVVVCCVLRTLIARV